MEASVATSERIALGDAYNEHEGTIANYVLMVAIPWGAMRRAGIDPASPRGDLLTGLWKFAAYLVLPLVVALVSGTVDDAPLLAWVLVAAVFGCGATCRMSPPSRNVSWTRGARRAASWSKHP